MQTPSPAGNEAARPGAAWIVAGGALLVAPALAVSFAACGFFLGASLSWWQGPLALAFAFLWSAHASRALGLPVRRTVATTWALTIGAVVASGLVCSRIYDLGFDSQSYHMLGIVELANGWNPVRQPDVTEGAYSLFVDHYSTGTWVQAALLYLTTRDLEAAKVLNVVALVASFCLWRGALVYVGWTSARTSWLVALAAALNPIAIVQAMTFYVDGYLASTMTSLVAILLLVVRSPSRVFLGLGAAALVLLANTKFTGVVYPLPLLAAAGYFLYRRGGARGPLRAFVVSQALAYAAAVGFSGYHPYVTNTLAHGHPFYPLRGQATAHDVAALRPPALAHVEGRLERLSRSLFADAASPWRESADIYKLPFSVSPAELELYGTPDARVGGWGPLFSGILLVSAVGFCALVARSKERGIALSVVVSAILGSTLLNSECWWARFSPQLLLLPLAVGLGLSLRARSSADTRWRVAGFGLVALVLANAALVLTAQVASVPRRSARVEHFLDGLSHLSGVLYVADRWVAPLRRLREHGVAFTPIRDDGPDPDPALEARVPCRPLREFPGTMNEIRYCFSQNEPVAFTR